MLLPHTRLHHIPVMGLQTGTELGRLSAPVIDPRRLEIVAYEVTGPLISSPETYLRIADVRELSDLGMIIDSNDEFIAIDDIVRLKEIHNFHFKLLDMKVIDERRRHLGKVGGYTIESDSFLIQQLSVKPSLLRSINNTQLLIRRTQIVEISDDVIVVKAGEHRPEPVRNSVRRAYHNPFQNPNPQPERIDDHH